MTPVSAATGMPASQTGWRPALRGPDHGPVQDGGVRKHGQIEGGGVFQRPPQHSGYWRPCDPPSPTPTQPGFKAPPSRPVARRTCRRWVSARVGPEPGGGPGHRRISSTTAGSSITGSVSGGQTSGDATAGSGAASRWRWWLCVPGRVRAVGRTNRLRPGQTI